MQNIIEKTVSDGWSRLGNARESLYYKRVATDYDPVQQEFSSSQTVTRFLAIVGSYTGKEVDNLNVMRTDIKVLAFNDLGFKEGDLVAYRGANYSIKSAIRNRGLIQLQLRNV